MPFEEKTWEWATNPEDSGPGCAPIEGYVCGKDDAWRAAVLERLEDTEKWPQVEFIVFAQNADLSSSELGSYNVVLSGAECTWKAEHIAELKVNSNLYWLGGDLPSRRLYPQWYISRESHFKIKDKNKKDVTIE